MSLSESSRDSEGDYREEPEERGAREGQEHSRYPPAAELVGGGSDSTGHSHSKGDGAHDGPGPGRVGH